MLLVFQGMSLPREVFTKSRFLIFIIKKMSTVASVKIAYSHIWIFRFMILIWINLMSLQYFSSGQYGFKVCGKTSVISLNAFNV